MRRILLMILITAAALTVGCTKLPTSSFTCSAGPDEKCPEAADYSKMKAFVEKYKAPQQEADEMNGLWTRVQGQAPPGYHLDITKLMFVKNAPIAPAPAPTK